MWICSGKALHVDSDCANLTSQGMCSTLGWAKPPGCGEGWRSMPTRCSSANPLLDNGPRDAFFAARDTDDTKS